jgi:hypothetical protein
MTPIVVKDSQRISLKLNEITLGAIPLSELIVLATITPDGPMLIKTLAMLTKEMLATYNQPPQTD